MKKYIRIGIAGIICAAIVVGYYYYLSNSAHKSAEDVAKVTEYQKVISRDMENSYPATPRAVVKFYNRIECCFYNEEHTNEELEELGAQARTVMDQELLDNNPEAMYYKALEADVADYREAGRKLTTVTVEDSSDVVYKNIKGEEWAYVDVAYFIKDGKSYKKTYEQFMLRQDEDDKWKIIGFYKVKGDIASDDE